MCFDPDILNPLEIHCTAISTPPAEIHWLVNDKLYIYIYANLYIEVHKLVNFYFDKFIDQSVHIDHSFYTVTSSVMDDKTISIVKGKSRTRTDNLTCVASNPAGDVTVPVQVTIRGPGSPPSSITLSSERGGYTVTWLPPSHSNGNITKYVVYHSFNKDDPLSDWHKLDLDGSESSVR
uniref:Fibronectin type-III domain-containing protein n=1 Tax=Heterorhabditis bacteriophora TaxID=37862 RepID=A0A1I7WWJ2_HETBA